MRFEFLGIQDWPHFLITEIVTQGVWWGVSAVIGISTMVRDIIAGIAFIAVIFAVAWYLPKWKTKGSSDMENHAEAIEKSGAVWGMWYTGDNMRGKNLLRSGKIMRILLLNPSLKNIVIDEHAKTADATAYGIRLEIELTRHYAETYGIPIRFYTRGGITSFTIYDPKPRKNEKGELIPNSELAWVCTQGLAPIVNRDERPIDKIKNCGKDKAKFEAYFRLFGDVWNNESLDWKDVEKPPAITW